MDVTSKRLSLNDFTSSKLSWSACIAVIALVATCLGTLVWYNQRPDNVLSMFRQEFDNTRDIEANWNAGILSLQLGIAPHYDDVTENGRNLKLSLEKLKRRVLSDRSLMPLLEPIQTYEASVARKAWLFEQAKASYAMLKNSVAVIPDAASDFYKHPEASLTLDSNKRASDFITESMTSMMSFTTSPTTLLRKAVDQNLAQTRVAAEKASPPLKEAMMRFISQVEVVVKERLKGNELIVQIGNVPTNTDVDKISDALHNVIASKEATKRTLWTTIITVSALLVAAFVAFTYVFTRRFVKLDNDNRFLQQVNENVEEQLVQSAKLSALGQMVAGITHEINTPLAYVKAVFELIKERVLTEDNSTKAHFSEEEEERREELMMLLDDGLHGLNEMATLVRTMKNFSRLDKGTIEAFSVEEGIESALLLARPQLKYVADVRKDFDNVPAVMGSPTQIRQVLLNLIVNAADAMATTDRRGILTLRTRITSSDTVQIEVCDNGPGVPEHILPKLFDPFFTTKPVGKGTGMGLSICYRIIENHGGTIALNSKLGKGTVVTITLPRQDEKRPPITIGSEMRHLDDPVAA